MILGLGVVAVAATAAFLYTETRAAEPVLPLHVFKNRNFSVATGMSFLLGMAMLGALTFLPLYQQTVQHLSAVGSGLMLIPMMLGVTVTSLIGGFVMTKTGRYKSMPIVGGAIMSTRHGPADRPRRAHQPAPRRASTTRCSASAWAS